MKTKVVCRFDECGRASWVRGYCANHYYELLRSGALPRKVKRKVRSSTELFHASYIIDPDTRCWEWTGWSHSKGYAYIQTHDQKKVKASRFSYKLYIGKLTDSEMVLHACDNRKCVNPAHLFPGDAGANSRDCVAKGRHWTATAVSMRKITRPMAMNVRIMYARGGHSMQNLATIYSVDQQTIGRIVHGRGHLEVA